MVEVRVARGLPSDPAGINGVCEPSTAVPLSKAVFSRASRRRMSRSVSRLKARDGSRSRCIHPRNFVLPLSSVRHKAT